RQQYYSTPYSF
nr:immunoglobulin light chain junction region [Macaca mulatta]